MKQTFRHPCSQWTGMTTLIGRKRRWPLLLTCSVSAGQVSAASVRTALSMLLLTELAKELEFSEDEVQQVRSENPNSLQEQSNALLQRWTEREGKHATGQSPAVSAGGHLLRAGGRTLDSFL
ncbi:hypothetical protein NFI96_025439 [Prochilodus magdalenae]|nr:hypothetical protein NFI96_025439 [Prochilodus magdalenae]